MSLNGLVRCSFLDSRCHGLKAPASKARCQGPKRMPAGGNRYGGAQFNIVIACACDSLAHKTNGMQQVHKHKASNRGARCTNEMHGMNRAGCAVGQAWSRPSLVLATARHSSSSACLQAQL